MRLGGRRLLLIGHSRAGLSLAAAWRDAGIEIGATWNRSAAGRAGLPGVPVVTGWSDLRGPFDLVLVAVRDDAIEAVAESLAPHAAALGNGEPTLFFHLSGSRPATALAALAGPGRSIAAFHPLHAFARVIERRPLLAGHLCAVEGGPAEQERLGQLARLIGGRPVAIRPEDRGLWHLAAVTASNFTVALLWQAQRWMEKAGIPADLALGGLLDLARGALDQVTAEGGARAGLTGPVARGDRSALEAHRSALAADPDGLDLYRRLVRLNLELAGRNDPGLLDPPAD